VNEQVSMVESGALKFFIDGREEIVRAGEVLTIPPHAPHAVEVLEDSVVVDVFSPPRDDWKRGDDAYLRR
jgi:quercetin dioxygenase-like cupin family protein